eukprot:1146819-Pelagomonas_calceolata.AAC.2
MVSAHSFPAIQPRDFIVVSDSFEQTSPFLDLLSKRIKSKRKEVPYTCPGYNGVQKGALHKKLKSAKKKHQRNKGELLAEHRLLKGGDETGL